MCVELSCKIKGNRVVVVVVVVVVVIVAVVVVVVVVCLYIVGRTCSLVVVLHIFIQD